VDESALSGCGVVVGIGTEETPMTTTGTLEDGTTSLLVFVPLGGDTELVTSGRGTDVRVIETTGGGTDPEPAGGKLVIVESGGTVPEGTPVLDGNPPEIGGISVLLGISLDVDVSESLELVDVAGGGRALELPLSGVTIQDLSSLTRFAPFTTIGVRVIVHV